MNKLSKLRQQSASSIGSVNTRHAATHNPLSAVAQIKADNANNNSRPATADDQSTTDTQSDAKRQKLASTQSVSSSSLPLSIPDPNATQDRVRRKAPAKSVHTSLPASSDGAASQPSHTSAVSASVGAASAHVAVGGHTAWNIQDDVTSERRFYQSVLSLDPTKAESAAPAGALLPAVPTASPPPPPPHRFADARSYQSFFLPLLLSDFACQLQQSFDANVVMAHSYAAQVGPLILLQAAKDVEGGRGVGEDMWRAELLEAGGSMDRDTRRRSEKQLREWMNGDLALLRHHQKDDAVDDEKEPVARGGRGGRGGRARDRQLTGSQTRMSRVDCYVMCVIESVTPIRGDDDYAPGCSVRVRVHLPNLSSSSASSASPPTAGVGSLARRTRQMWNLFQPPSLEEKEERNDKSATHAADGVFSLIRLDSPVTTLREYIALQHIDSLTLLPQLLQPSSDPATTPPASTELSAVNSSSPVTAAESATSEVERTFSMLPNNFRSYLTSHLNDHQLQAVKSATHRTLSPGFTLLQGPPGTGTCLRSPHSSHFPLYHTHRLTVSLSCAAVLAGKTKTVIAVLNCLHLRAFQRHYDSLIDSILTATTAVEQSNSSTGATNMAVRGDSAAQPITLDDLIADLSAPASTSASAASSAVSFHRIQPKPRLLVCAPSNAGVDEIITRVLGDDGKGGFVDGALALYTPAVVRIGTSDNIRDEVKQRISLDVLVDAYMRLTAEQLEARARHAAKVSSDTRRELDQWVLTYRKRLDSFMRERGGGDGGGRPPAAHEVVEAKFLSSVAHLHERLHLASLDRERCESVSTFYTSSGAAAGFTPSLTPRERSAAVDRLRLSFLNEAHIVFSTLSGAGLALLSSTLSHPFSTLLIDEAAQATELSTLVSFRHNLPHVILIGDPKQLPATVFLQKETRDRQAIERSLFQRLQSAGHPVLPLLTQYRMHSEVRSFPSRFFYDNALMDGANVTSGSYQRPYHAHPLLRPFVWLDVRAREYERLGEADDLRQLKERFVMERGGRSSGNVVEAAFVVRLVERVLSLYGVDIAASGIGVITFYQQQKRLIEQMLAAQLPAGTLVEVSTVDGFQGREKDVIIVSCVRQGKGGGGSASKGGRARSIGFVSDVRRMNVALTRGKYGMWVVGDVEVLSGGSEEWAALAADARRRGLVRSAADVARMDESFIPLRRRLVADLVKETAGDDQLPPLGASEVIALQPHE